MLSIYGAPLKPWKNKQRRAQKDRRNFNRRRKRSSSKFSKTDGCDRQGMVRSIPRPSGINRTIRFAAHPASADFPTIPWTCPQYWSRANATVQRTPWGGVKNEGPEEDLMNHRPLNGPFRGAVSDTNGRVPIRNENFNQE